MTTSPTPSSSTPPVPVLEGAAQAFADATANPPYLFDLSVSDGRKTVDQAQDGDFPDPAATREDLTIAGGPSGEVKITIYRPSGEVGVLPVVLYTHGAGWVFGDVHTHDRLVRELTTRAEAATVFVSYSLSPEAKYPTAIEEVYSALEWIAASGPDHDLDPGRIAVAGDSVGGNMTAAITILAKRRGGPRIAASPLRATAEDLAGLPPALIINGEADVLRDEGEAYAARLRAAGVPVTSVRYNGTIHDFVMLNALRDTRASKAATAAGGEFLRAALWDE
jgi:acetyl esterase